ncbi:MAG: Spy/CpxP family protein refolding chaperone, partial [Pseudomonadota bacterium]|nr:Spy/CpxP family protein refolding chaperone [Pseudomonadota bacterium]
MKKLLIASATVAAISLGGFALAQPAGPGMRHHEPVKEIVKHLRGLSLSDAQREEIKTLVSAFKDANPRVEYQDSEKPDFDFETASEAQISAFIETQFEERESKHFALAQLRHNIFNVLSEEQQAKVLAREEGRDQKRAAKGDKRRDASNERKSQFAKRMDGEGKGKGKKFRDHGKGERGDRDHQRNGTPFKGIDLTDDQLANLAELRESFKDTSNANRETLRSFKDAQRDLIRSSSFSQDTWNALVAQYKDDLVSAGVEKAK